jgi:hypothetical protein
LVGSGELTTTTSCRHSESRGRGMMRPCVTDETWRRREKKACEENKRTGRRRGVNEEWTTGSRQVEASDNKDGTKSTHLFFR